MLAWIFLGRWMHTSLTFTVGRGQLNFSHLILSISQLKFDFLLLIDITAMDTPNPAATPKEGQPSSSKAIVYICGGNATYIQICICSFPGHFVTNIFLNFFLNIPIQSGHDVCISDHRQSKFAPLLAPKQNECSSLNLQWIPPHSLLPMNNAVHLFSLNTYPVSQESISVTRWYA